MVGRDMGPWALRDDEGRVRLTMRRPDLDDLLELAVTGPRRYGAADPDVLARLSVLLPELAWSTDLPARGRAIRGHLDRLTATAAAQDFDVVEQARMGEMHRRVEAALRGEWRPDAPKAQFVPAADPQED